MSKKPIRILMLITNLRVSNGVTSYAMNYFRALDHRSVHIDFCLIENNDSPYFEEIEKAGSHYYFTGSWKRPLKQAASFAKLLKEGRYDIVHDNLSVSTILLMREAKKQGVPVRILHSHNSKLGETPQKEKRNALLLPLLLSKVNAFAACSDMAAKAMFGDAKYELIPNIIDADKYSFDPEIRKTVREQMGADGKFIVATVGRLAAQKNPFFALDVFDLVAEKIPHAEYWWIGSGPLYDQVAAYASKLKHADHVRLLGDREDMKDLYQAADVMFMPSLFEGLPVTGVEAQAMGLPCVVSDSVTREMVYTDLVEYVCLDAGKEQWAETICRQLKNHERKNKTDELMQSRFSDKNAGEFLEQYYRRLLENVTAG